MYEHWYFVSKIVLTYCEKNVLVIKNFVFEILGLIPLERFIQTVKGMALPVMEFQDQG